MRTEDGHIVNKCLNGDSAAFGFLVDKYKASIYAFAYDRLQNFHDAEDVTQEVFLKAYQKLRTLKRYDSFLAWLYSMTSNACKMLIRARSRRPDSEFIEDVSLSRRPSVDPYREQQNRESLHESLREALNSLPEIYRQALTLHYFGGMSSKEIAMFVGASPAAIRKRLSKARSLLKEEMLAMMNTTFEEQRLQAAFTFRIVQAVKRIKIQPMPRMVGLPWGLSLAAGIIVAALSLNPHLNLFEPMTDSSGSSPLREARVLKTGEIPVDILRLSRIPVLASMRGEGDDKPGPQKTAVAAAQGKGGTWARKADMQDIRDLFNACVVDGEIYAIGGNDDDLEPLLSTVEKYNPETNTWTKLADMPTVRCMHSTSLVNGEIYVIGGSEIIFGNPRIWPVLVYDPAKNEWMEKANPPVKISNHGSVVVNGKIYVLGGSDLSARAVSRVFEYDPGTDTWTRKADMPTARHSPVAGLVNGKIYVIGGGAPQWPWPNGECHPLSTVEEYNPVTDTWTTKADMPTARHAVSGCVLDGKIYVIGGQSQKGSFTNKVEEYDPKTDTWKRVADMPTPRAYLSSIAVNGRIYAIGGRVLEPVEAMLSTVEEYTPEGWHVVSPQGKLPTKWGETKSD